MNDINHKMPSRVFLRMGSPLAYSTAVFALAGVFVCSPMAARAQIEVDIITSDTVAHKTTTGPTGLKEDKSADEAARKIVPEPGTAMQSTENSTLGPEEAVAQSPSVEINKDQVVLKEGETTETVAVRSGAELLRMLGLQRATEPDDDKGREMDEDTSGTLFDMEAVRRLKGDEPTVVYRVVVDETPLPDPMIVPWIRQAKLLQERFDNAVDLLGENRLDEGRQELLGIITDFPDSDHAKQARAILAKLDDLDKSEIPAPFVKRDETTISVELSPNIRIGTVIVDPDNAKGNRVMIDGRIYGVGDEVNAAPGHKVIGITDSVVKIEVEKQGTKKIFDVPVRPLGATE